MCIVGELHGPIELGGLHISGMPSHCSGMQAMVACTQLNQFEEILRQSKSSGATWRNVLAQHTSKCCARAHARGPVQSLSDCGIDVVQTLVSGQVFTELKLHPLFDVPEGDAAPQECIVCSGPACDTQCEAQEAIIRKVDFQSYGIVFGASG